MSDKFEQVEIRVPQLPESVDDATVLVWHKNLGDAVTKDDNLVDLETDKVVLEVPSPISGTLQDQAAKEGDVVKVDSLLGVVGRIIVGNAPKPDKSAASENNNINDGESIDNAILRIIERKLGPKAFHVGIASDPAEFLGNMAETVRYDKCFVVMPYSEPWSQGVETVIKESCLATEYTVEIAKTMEGRFVPHDIWKGITGSGLVIADISGSNANVAYEVGLADAIGREVILIAQSSSVPFDFSGQRLLLYENTVGGALVLRKELVKRLKSHRKKRNE